MTQALNRLEGEGLLVSRTQSPKRDGKKPKKVWGQVQHAYQNSLSKDGIRDARVASGLPAAEDAQTKGATAKAGKGARAARPPTPPPRSSPRRPTASRVEEKRVVLAREQGTARASDEATTETTTEKKTHHHTPRPESQHLMSRLI